MFMVITYPVMPISVSPYELMYLSDLTGRDCYSEQCRLFWLSTIRCNTMPV